jgi:hypothetical protein
MGKKATKAITVRGVPPEVERVIQRRSSASGESVNKTVLELIEEGAGLRRKRRKALHHDLDGLFGVWSRQEAAAFDRLLAEQRKIDEDLWK